MEIGLQRHKGKLEGNTLGPIVTETSDTPYQDVTQYMNSDLLLAANVITVVEIIAVVKIIVAVKHHR